MLLSSGLFGRTEDLRAGCWVVDLAFIYRGIIGRKAGSLVGTLSLGLFNHGKPVTQHVAVIEQIISQRQLQQQQDEQHHCHRTGWKKEKQKWHAR